MQHRSFSVLVDSLERPGENQWREPSFLDPCGRGLDVSRGRDFCSSYMCEDQCFTAFAKAADLRMPDKGNS